MAGSHLHQPTNPNTRISLGLIESLGAGYLGALTGGFLGSQYSDIFAFIVLAVVLTLRPSGLLGERVADRA